MRLCTQTATSGRILARILVAVVCTLVLTGHAWTSVFAQSTSDSQPSAGGAPPETQAPALVDRNGPPISLQNSEALFYLAAALNSCGYDSGLAQSDPVRMEIRHEIDQALIASADARNIHDQLCQFIDEHRLANPSLNLAQYVSLALFTTPPPDLTPSVAQSSLPPDSTQVENILPLVRQFSRAIDLRLIWVRSRTEYDAELSEIHNSLNKMIAETDAYLKMPAAAYPGERFVVVIEPLLDPGQVNARVYGSDYVVVASPSHGDIRMNEVRHTYLHYQIEPLLYARAGTLEQFQPFLKLVQTAPIDWSYRSDVVPLMVECLIRAIEYRTMNTGITVYKVPDNIRRSDLEEATQRHNATVREAELVRQKAVDRSMSEGFILTRYFYNQLIAFEKQPESLKESIGRMVFGMDVESELNKVKHIQFVSETPRDVLQRQEAPAGLDLAEQKLIKGDAKAASSLAQQAIREGVGEPGRANFILARAAILQGDIPAARSNFEKTTRLAKDPRMLAWSHIYLGRIDDVESQREQALEQYRAALTVRDGQPDTAHAAEQGLKEPYTVPQQVHTAPANSGEVPDAQETGNAPSGRQ